MDPKVASVAAAPDLGLPQPQPAAPAARTEAPVATGPTPDELRLVIEMDQASGTYVYKTINRATGEVVQQLPREEILKLRHQVHYAAGGVIDTKA
ncbi:MAG: flagellar protein FlaG [Caulobacterales bacterium]|nr:flagellar protein FlaG [Caulobacterales bacterium]